MKKKFHIFSVAIMLLINFSCSAHQFAACSSAASAKLIWPDGSQYSGDVNQNKPDGIGRMVWVSGSTYEGQWKNGMRTGAGAYTWPDGRSYRGDFSNDEMHGKGTATWPSGDWYEGGWQHNRRTGAGVLVRANGDRYSGIFLNDLPHGRGTMRYKNGSSVTGLFVYGVHKKLQPQDFIDHVISSDVNYRITALGAGRILVEYPNGDTYQGDFCQGWFEGGGVFSFSDGTSLSGMFHNNRFIYGKKTYLDGSWYEGGFLENYSKTKDGKRHSSSLRHGFGTYFSASGVIIKRGHWSGDHFSDAQVPVESPRPFGPDDEDILI